MPERPPKIAPLKIAPLKIAQVTSVDYSLRNFLLPLMRGARGRGHEVVGVCADGPLLDVPRAEGFRIVPVPMARSLDPRAQGRAFRALLDVFRAERFDLVHGHNPISGLLARAAARRAGVPRVAYTCHGFLFNQPGPGWRRGLALGLELMAGRITDTFLTVSEEEAADARRLRIHPRATAVLNGRDPAVFRPDAAARAAVRAELGVAPKACVVVVVSRLVRHKGHPELLLAMRGVPDAELWVVGDRLPTDHGESLDRDFASAEAALGPRLRRLGYRHDVARLLAAADVFALPSHFEGLPMSVVEAMLTGLPVVATDVRGPREQVVEGVTGLLVPPGEDEPLAEALRRLSADAALRARMGEAGRARALERYTEAEVLARTLDLLGL
jgi:glycosyltransferase involved in cell wall biosynthesis